MTSNAVTAMMIFQVILSFFLKGALNDLWGLFFTLQMMCYITIYDTIIPSSAEMYLTEVTKIIEFDIFSPEGFVKLFNPAFDLRAYISGVEIAINKDQEASVIKDLQVYILFIVIAIVFVCLTLLASFIFKAYKQKIMKKLEAIKKKFLWNGAVRYVYISFVEICLSVAVQM